MHLLLFIPISLGEFALFVKSNMDIIYVYFSHVKLMQMFLIIKKSLK